MKIYAKIIGLVMLLVGAFGVGFPVLFSTASDVAVGIGIIGGVVLLPVVFLWGKSILEDILKMYEKYVMEKE